MATLALHDDRWSKSADQFALSVTITAIIAFLTIGSIVVMVLLAIRRKLRHRAEPVVDPFPVARVVASDRETRR